MARKPKEPEASERVMPSHVLKSISAKKLKDLLAGARQTKQDVDEIVGTHREAIAVAVEKSNLHKGAFAMIKRLDRLESGKLADWLDYLDHYLDIAGLRDKAATAPRLGMGDAASEQDNSDDDRGNVAAFPKAAE